MRRVSGPLLDRIDMQIEMARVPPAELLGSKQPEDSATVARRILAARDRALRRNGGRPNAHLAGSAVQGACALTALPTDRLARWPPTTT